MASKPPDPAVVTPPQPKRRRHRGLRRPRFGFDVTLPDTQLAADTTDLRAFDVPLKLVAAQDVGGRDVDLLDAVLVDEHEYADHVATVIAEAVAEPCFASGSTLYQDPTPMSTVRRASAAILKKTGPPSRPGPSLPLRI